MVQHGRDDPQRQQPVTNFVLGVAVENVPQSVGEERLKLQELVHFSILKFLTHHYGNVDPADAEGQNGPEHVHP